MSHPQPLPQRATLTSLFVRLVWMAFGPAALFVLAVVIARRGEFSVLDVCLAIVFMLVVAARWLDISRYGGKTAEGNVATVGHFRGYLVRLAVLSAMAWGGAHLISRLIA